jgi:putative transposase
MARTRREVSGGHFYHVLNRGVRRSTLFATDEDYEEFQHLMARAAERVPMRLMAYTLMPNHWHLVLWPEHDGAISAYIKWLAGTHACNFNARHKHVGAVYQRRFTSVPVRDDVHLLTVLRYVEANPVRAALVSRAEWWRWSSVTWPAIPRLTPSPVRRPPQWLDLLADPSLDLLDAAQRMLV